MKNVIFKNENVFFPATKRKSIGPPHAPHPSKTLSLSWNLWQTVDFICIETELEVGGEYRKKQLKRIAIKRPEAELHTLRVIFNFVTLFAIIPVS